MTYTYPEKPANVSTDFANPSTSFQQSIRATIVILCLYFASYLLLLLAGLALGAGTCALGFWFMMHANIMGLLVGCGLIVSGGLIIFFPLKFIFASKTASYEGLTEIKAEEQPELFEFVRRVSEEVGTQFPKKIFISNEVNASVFYDSTFLSMFLPVPKNLNIGLGLVNVLNVSEFKAVLAHEFGHFSQKSMRAGSYVYQVNRAIYNMLFDTNSYNSILGKMAGFHYVLSFIAWLTSRVLIGIQALQRFAYTIVNKQYNKLSREMEYHADTVSAMVSGSNNLTSALKMIAAGDNFYQAVIGEYNTWLKDDIRGYNLYADQRTNARFYAKVYGLLLTNGLPDLPPDYAFASEYQKVRLEDVWASHPTPEQRDAHLNSLGIVGKVVEDSAWLLFRDAEQLQTTATEQLYAKVPKKGKLMPAEPDKYEQSLATGIDANYDDPFYEHFYEQRYFSDFDTNDTAKPTQTITDISQFFKEAHQLVNQATGMETDMETLKKLVEQPKVYPKFTYEGEVYRSRNAAEVLATVTAKYNEVKEAIKEAERIAYNHFLAIAPADDRHKLEMQYKQYIRLFRHLNSCVPRMDQILKKTGEYYVEDPTDNIYKNSPPDFTKESDELKALFAETRAIVDSFEASATDVTFPADMATREERIKVMYAGQCTAENINRIHDTTYNLYTWGHEAIRKLKAEILATQLAIYQRQANQVVAG